MRAKKVRGVMFEALSSDSYTSLEVTDDIYAEAKEELKELEHKAERLEELEKATAHLLEAIEMLLEFNEIIDEGFGRIYDTGSLFDYRQWHIEEAGGDI